jgi:hypothetical protein
MSVPSFSEETRPHPVILACSLTHPVILACSLTHPVILACSLTHPVILARSAGICCSSPARDIG